MESFETFTEAVGVFFDKADWLSDNEAPAMTALAKAAKELDKRVSSTMLAEFGKVFRYLRGLKPADSEAVDDLDALLATL